MAERTLNGHARPGRGLRRLRTKRINIGWSRRNNIPTRVATVWSDKGIISRLAFHVEDRLEAIKLMVSDLNLAQSAHDKPSDSGLDNPS